MVINALFIKPIDMKLLNKIIKDNYKIIVIEDNVINGGLGSNIISETKYSNVDIIGINDKYIEHGSSDELLKIEKLTEKDIEKKVNKILSNHSS